MNTSKLLAAALVSLALIGGLAAVGAASPTDAADGDDTDADSANASDRVDSSEDRPDVVGLDDLPEQAPDFVSDIHDAIGSFLDDSIENLGESLRNLLASEAPPDAGTAGDEITDQGAEYVR